MVKRLYTKRGDGGETSLLNGVRVAKNDERIEINGVLDELSSVLGVLRTMDIDTNVKCFIEDIQRALMVVMSHVASSGEVGDMQILAGLTDKMEQEIDLLTAGKQFSFVVPGKDVQSAWFHLARSKTRTCERKLCSEECLKSIDSRVLKFMNRLSDYLFAQAEY